jgi:hypothetical protein
MSRSLRTRVYYWATPALSLLFGLAFLLAFMLGGHPVAGAIALVLMLVLAAASLVLGRYSETMRGLMDRRDERIVSLDQRAVNGAAMVLLLVLIGATIEEVARGRSGAPFTWLAAVFGLTYLATLVVLRLRA